MLFEAIQRNEELHVTSDIIGSLLMYEYSNIQDLQDEITEDRNKKNEAEEKGDFVESDRRQVIIREKIKRKKYGKDC